MRLNENAEENRGKRTGQERRGGEGRVERGDENEKKRKREIVLKCKR